MQLSPSRLLAHGRGGGGRGGGVCVQERDLENALACDLSHESRKPEATAGTGAAAPTACHVLAGRARGLGFWTRGWCVEQTPCCGGVCFSLVPWNPVLRFQDLRLTNPLGNEMPQCFRDRRGVPILIELQSLPLLFLHGVALLVSGLLIGSLGGGPVPAVDVTMDDPRKKMCLQKPSPQTRPKCSPVWKFPSLNQVIMDLRTGYLSLWLLGSEEKKFHGCTGETQRRRRWRWN